MSVEKMVPKSRAGDPDFPGIPELVPFQGPAPCSECGFTEQDVSIGEYRGITFKPKGKKT